MAEKYALQSEIPNKLSQLENDSKFLADSGGWQGPIPGEKVWSHTTPGGGEFVLTEEVPEGGGSATANIGVDGKFYCREGELEVLAENSGVIAPIWGRYKQVDLSSLDQNKWYPCAIGLGHPSSQNRPIEFYLQNALDGSAILCRWYFCLNQIIMKRILVQRTYRGSAYTIGKLFIDGNYICDTLEDVDRGLSSNMSEDEIKKIKIYGETAIPAGTYKVIMNVVSEKFKNRVWAKPYKGKLPRLVDVPGYEGVLIHVGNTAKDTLGCILVGENKVKGQVISSTNAFNKLMNILKDEEDIELTIK